MAALAIESPPVTVDADQLASLGGWVLAFLTLIGGGIKWAVGSRNQRQRWIEEAVEKHVSKLEVRLCVAERKADRLEKEKRELADQVNQVVLAFRLVADELQQSHPQSLILREARTLFTRAFPLPRNTPDVMRDDLDELHERTKEW